MIGANIKRLRLQKRYSQEQLARKLSVTQGAVSQWEKGRTVPDTQVLIQLSKIFDVPLDAFTNDLPLRELDGLVAIRRSSVPIIGEIACGTPITAEQNIEGYTDLPDGIHADFALRCKGDSMTPTFIDGDLVLIRKQPEVETGQIAAVNINGETTLKHVYYQQGGLLLTADNASYSPIYVPAGSDEEIIIHGPAIGYTRIFG